MSEPADHCRHKLMSAATMLEELFLALGSPEVRECPLAVLW